VINIFDTLGGESEMFV